MADGFQYIFNCAMPRYDRWPEEFPPLAAAALQAAESTGASLITASNVYGYGAAPSPFREDAPMIPSTIKGEVRARMWEAALRSRAPVCEVRGSDYLGCGATSLFTLMTLPAILQGQPAVVPGDLDAVHSWTFTSDVARTLAAAASSDASWGRAWHVPSTDLTPRELTTRVAALAGLPTPQLRAMPLSELQTLATSDSILREVVEMSYLYYSECRLDSTDTERTLGIASTPIDEVIRDMLET
jgi:nucleoside-diphosphate-sugar epimerase